MQEKLFSKVDVDPTRTHVPDGADPDPLRACRRYDRLCAYQKIGFKRLVKKALREYYRTSGLQDPEPVLENQLDLFEPVDLFGQPIRKRK